MSVIELLNRQRVTSLESLHRTTGVPKPTLVRLLETLIATGYVSKVSRKEGYAVTDSVLRLAAGVRDRDVIVHAARPLMEAFTHEQKWQVSLATYENGAMVVRATTRHISPFSRDQPSLNRQARILNSALGRAYLAFCSPREREFILTMLQSSDSAEAEFARSCERIDAMIDKIRLRRYATEPRGRPGPFRSLAIPIGGPRPGQDILGSMVMHWYGSVMSEQQAVQRYLGELYDLADQIAFDAADRTAADRGVGSGRSPACVAVRLPG
jgi:IclR family mhp operon transcriptional activator